MTLVSRIAELIATDDCDQSRRLCEEYAAATPEARTALDDVFICLCGYSLATLIAEEEGDDDPEDDADQILA